MVVRKIRVLHVGISNHLGGIETYLMKLTSHVDRDKYQFDFLIYNNQKPCFYDELKSLGCRFHSVTSRRKNFLNNRIELKKLFYEEKFDIVHCHQNSLSYITPVIFAQRRGCGVVVHSRNAGSLSGVLTRLRHKINYYRLPKNKITCVAVSDLAGDWMFGKNTQVLVLNNGLDTELYKYNPGSRQEIRAEFNLGDREVILHIGAFRVQKNHDFLIEVFKAYHDIHPESVLLMAGDGSLRHQIERKVSELGIANDVVFAGLRSDVPKLLSAADKFLFPSFYEGFPNALVEAETAGLYCVASNRITEQVRIKDTCNFISLDSPISFWVAALEQPLNLNRERFAVQIENAGLCINKEMENLYKVYDSILE